MHSTTRLRAPGARPTHPADQAHQPKDITIPNKPHRELRRIRAAAFPHDLDSEALRLPADRIPARVPDHCRSDQPPADPLGTLLASCQERGIDPAPALGYAIHHATYEWARQIDLFDALPALAIQAHNATERLYGRQQHPYAPGMFDLILAASIRWDAAGRPGLDVTAAVANSLVARHLRRKRVQ